MVIYYDMIKHSFVTSYVNSQKLKCAGEVKPYLDKLMRTILQEATDFAKVKGYKILTAKHIETILSKIIT
jgi:hypothetical protein